MRGLRFVTLPVRLRQRPCRLMFRRYWPVTKKLLSPVVYSSLRLYCRLGYWPRIRHPESLNEKVLHRNLFQRDPLFPLVSDKYRVREYVTDKVGDEILNRVHFVTAKPAEIPFDDLPEKYAIKANHGCGWNILVDGSEPVNREEVIATCYHWLGKTYGREGYEPMYEDIEPCILVEDYIVDRGFKAPRDFKFYCFHGKVGFIQYQAGRFEGMRQNFYDADWNLHDVTMRVPPAGEVERPALFDEMTRIAERLGEDFEFARIDLYSPGDERIVFGEITLSPGSGGLGFTPRSYDWKFGSMWKLDRSKSSRRPIPATLRNS